MYSINENKFGKNREKLEKLINNLLDCVYSVKKLK